MKFFVVMLSLALFFPLLQCSKKEQKAAAQAALAGFGKITYLVGQVTITLPGKPAKPASLFAAIPSKTLIQTEKASKAVISLANLGDLAIGENSEIELACDPVKPIKSGEEAGTSYVARNFFGSLFVSIKKLTGTHQEFTVATPTATAAIRGTSFEVYVNPQTFSAQINVVRGTVAVKRNAKRTFSENKPVPPEAQEVTAVQAEAVKEIILEAQKPAEQAAAPQTEAPQPAASAEAPAPAKNIALVKVGESITIDFLAAPAQTGEAAAAPAAEAAPAPEPALPSVTQMDQTRFSEMSERVSGKVVKTISEQSSNEGVGEIAAAILDKPAEVIRDIVEPKDETRTQAAIKAVQEAVNFMAAPEPAAVEEKNTPPVFAAVSIPAAVSVMAALNIDARATDPEGGALRYSLEGAPEGMTISPFDGKIHWVPKTPGTYTFKVKAEDSKNLFTVKSFTVTVKQFIKASLKSSAPGGIAGKARIVFDASETVRQAGKSEALMYRFDFDGDGKWDFPGDNGVYSESPIAEYTYAKAGQFKAAVEAMNTQSGEASLAYSDVKIDPNYPLELKVKPVKKVNLAQAAEFDAEASDKNGAITGYFWDFNSDGSWDYQGATPMAGHLYGKPGIYTATLKALSSDGDSAREKVKVEVFNALPAAKACPAMTVKAGENVQFSGSGSDADSKIEKYGWDFDGDGQIDWKSSLGAEVRYTFKTPGAYNSILYVKTTDGQMAKDTVKVQGE